MIIAVLLLNKAVDLDQYRTELIMLIIMTCLSLAMVVARSQAYLLEQQKNNLMPGRAASLPTA